MSVTGEVTDTGPLKATIEVPDGVKVFWNQSLIGQLPLDTITAQPFVGAKIVSSQKFKILNKTAFVEFNKFMLKEREFTWHLEGTASVQSSGLNLQGITLSKDVTMGGNIIKNLYLYYMYIKFLKKIPIMNLINTFTFLHFLQVCKIFRQ
jgi:hypothetical protein